ncbi:MAG: Lrp/AsnC family transcriptional regulator [Aliivibrio sp.]|uniref:Lrp/AsnC family transcriptional regulator n=1 Tax=Aliivibrio sp. TaxID=1872443 RepID=UPI001A56AF55|nr:Lrp/AsnC family transcriptional regulator [Aliivibrio sp.]
MDRMDVHIIDIVQRDGRLTTTEIAEQVGLSASPCARRLKKLERQGVITGYRATINRKKVGLGVTIFVNVGLSNHQESAISHFENAILKMNEVINAHIVSGANDYLLEVVTTDLEHYEQFMRKLQTLSMVKDINTSLAIRSIKSNAPLELESTNKTWSDNE